MAMNQRQANTGSPGAGFIERSAPRAARTQQRRQRGQQFWGNARLAGIAGGKGFDPAHRADQLDDQIGRAHV